MSLGLAFSGVVWGVGCAQGSSGDDDGVTSGDAAVDGTVVGEDAGTPGEDAPVATGDDATTGGDDSASPGDDDGSTSSDDATTNDDGSSSGGDDGGSHVDDAGEDSAAPPAPDAGHDAGEDAGHDAGVDSGVDAGVDAGHDAGVDAGHDAGSPATIATGGACDGNLTCAAGDVCVGGEEVDGGGFVCHQVCTTDSNCTQPVASSGSTSEPGNGPHCVITITNASPAETVCSVPCNPVTAAGASGCPDGLACQYEGTSSISELTDCEPPGTVLAGSTCTDESLATSCDFGLTCIVTGTGTSGKCRFVCRAGVNSDCPAGDTCTTLSGIASPMFGFCDP